MSETLREKLAAYPDVSFIENLTFEKLLEKMICDYQDRYQELTGRETVLAAADPKRLILYTCAATIYQAFQLEDRAGKMGLLKYSKGEFLDNLAAFKNVKRNPSTAAVVTLRFELSAVQGMDIKIPKGTRVRAGELFFETEEQAAIAAGQLSADVNAVCQSAGSVGNGFAAGEIRTLVDPVNYVKSVTNINESNGGADEETDDDLAERIFLAPSGYSVAGPASAYDYWVRTYSQKIGDSYIGSNSPGEVDIYVMFNDGSLPDESFLNGLEAYLQGNEIRPLTDHVVVHAAEVVAYSVDATYYIAKSRENMAETIKEAANAACGSYVDWQREKIGRDINPCQLMYMLMEAGVKRINITQPEPKVIPAHALACADGVRLTYGGIEDD